MMYKHLLCLIFLTFFAQAQSNPLISPNKDTTRPIQKHTVSNYSTSRSIRQAPFLRTIFVWQKKLNAGLSALLRKIGKNFSLGSALLLFGIAFLYGLIHSLGPGHGKVIIGSYMLTRGYRLRFAWLAGALFALTHAGMAGVVYALFAVVMNRGKASLDAVAGNLYKASGGLVACIGAVLFFSAVMRKKEQRMQRDCGAGTGALAATAFAAGLTPCPGTMLLLIFSNLAGVPFYGWLSAVFLSIGMAVTVTTAGAVGIFAQKRAVSSAATRKHEFLAKAMRVVGSCIVFLVGCVMIFG